MQPTKIPETIPEGMKTDQKIVGFDLVNLLEKNTFISRRLNIVNLSFEINDIVSIAGNEIMKVRFHQQGIIMRMMKYKDSDDRPVATFDLVDESSKSIKFVSDGEFIGGIGMEEFFYQTDMITQWEIPIFLKMCRGFVLGDVETFQNLVENYHLKFSRENAWHLKNILGIK